MSPADNIFRVIIALFVVIIAAFFIGSCLLRGVYERHQERMEARRQARHDEEVREALEMQGHALEEVRAGESAASTAATSDLASFTITQDGSVVCTASPRCTLEVN